MVKNVKIKYCFFSKTLVSINLQCLVKNILPHKQKFKR